MSRKPRKPTKSQLEKIAEIDRLLEHVRVHHDYRKAGRLIFELYEKSVNPLVHAMAEERGWKWYDQRHRWPNALKAPSQEMLKLLRFFHKGEAKGMKRPSDDFPADTGKIDKEKLDQIEPEKDRDDAAERPDLNNRHFDHKSWEEAIRFYTGKNRPKSPSSGIRPSKSQWLPDAAIGEDEVAEFLSLVDRVGVQEVFDPANQYNNGAIIRQPLFKFKPHWLAVYFDEVWLEYDAQGFQRAWDPEDCTQRASASSEARSHEMSFVMDYVMIIAKSRQGWTYPRHDRYMSRLPYWLSMKYVYKQRPAWKAVNPILIDLGWLTPRSDRSFKLTPTGRKIATVIEDVWKGLIRPS